jgi:hypothetical protein
MVLWQRQPPESPFIKGDLAKSPLEKGGRGGCNSASILSRQNYYTFTMARCFYLFLNVFEGGERDEAEG